jgi:hypothetical protein
MKFLLRSVVLACLGLVLSVPVWALMAGSATDKPSDTPSLRTDPNSLTSPWAGVGSLRTPNGIFTGTAISKDYVLTAAHVVAGVAPADVRFALNANGDLSFASVAAGIVVNSGFVSAQQPNPNDLALVHLVHAIPENVPTYALAPNTVTLRSIILMVGYGASGDGAVGASVPGSASVKRTGRNMIDAFGREGSLHGEPRVAMYDFDGPPGTPNRIGGLTLGNEVETIVASGDSGGPCFVFEQGKWQLAAVSTFVVTTGSAHSASAFGSVGGAVLVKPHLDWIKATMRRPAAVRQTESVGLLVRFVQSAKRWFAAGSTWLTANNPNVKSSPSRTSLIGY